MPRDDPQPRELWRVRRLEQYTVQITIRDADGVAFVDTETGNTDCDSLEGFLADFVFSEE